MDNNYVSSLSIEPLVTVQERELFFKYFPVALLEKPLTGPMTPGLAQALNEQARNFNDATTEFFADKPIKPEDFFDAATSISISDGVPTAEKFLINALFRAYGMTRDYLDHTTQSAPTEISESAGSVDCFNAPSPY